MSSSYKSLKLKNKILLTSLLEIIALFLLFFVSQFFMERNTDLLSEIESNFVPALELGRDMEQMLIEIQRTMQYAVAASDEDSFKTSDQLYKNLIRLFDKGDENSFFKMKGLNLLKNEFKDYYSIARQNSMFLVKGNTLDEELINDLKNMKEQYNSIKNRLKDNTVQAKKEVSVSFSKALINSKNSAIIMNAIIISFAFLLGSLTLFISRSITKPLNRLVASTKRIAKGDLDHKIAIQTGDELEVLGNAMDRMRMDLLEFYQELEHLVDERTLQLQESESRFRNVISSISDYIYMVELAEDGTWMGRYLSPKIESLTGYPPDSFINDTRLWFSLILPEDQSIFLNHFHHLKEKENSEVEYRLVRSGKEEVWVRDSGLVKKRKDQKSIIVYGVVSDITERKNSESERIKLEEQLRQSQKLEAFGKLAGGTAHEFNNILAIILAAMELVLDELPEDSHQKQRLEQAYKTGERGQELIKEILIFSRSSQKEVTVLDLGKILNNVGKNIIPTLPYNVKLVNNIDHPQTYVLGNSLQIEQIIINLCNNSVHAFKGKNGTIKISLEQIKSTQLCLQFPDLPFGMYARIVVSDNGSGIPPDIKNQIFEPFFTTKDVGKGTGLGLSVVHGIVRQYGGRIAVQSESGTGTAFEILFPVTQQKTTSQVPSEDNSSNKDTSSTQSGKTKHILIIEDDRKSIRIPVLALKKLKYTLSIISESNEAVTSFKADPQLYDLVIAKQSMPEMTGIKICKKLKNIRNNIPLILYMEEHETIETEPTGKSGILRYFNKPLKVRQLTQAVREIIGSSR